MQRTPRSSSRAVQYGPSDYPKQSGALVWAVKLTTLSPSGWASGSRALDEAEEPTSPAGWLLTKRAKQFAPSGLAAPDAEALNPSASASVADSATNDRLMGLPSLDDW